MKRLASTLLWLAACSVPPNAILEVRLQLPEQVDASGQELGYAQVAVVTSDVEVDASGAWSFPSRTFALADRGAQGCNVELSVVSDDPEASRGVLERAEAHGLALVIWFCPTAEPCDARAAPRWFIDFDKALWPGERSRFEAAPAVGACSTWGAPDSTLPRYQRATETADGFAYTVRVSECGVLACLDETSQPADDIGFCSQDGVHPCD